MSNPKDLESKRIILTDLIRVQTRQVKRSIYTILVIHKSCGY